MKRIKKAKPMATLQIRLTEKQILKLQKLVDKGLYPNRSEATRDAIRRFLR